MTDFVVYGTVAWDRPWLTEQNLAHALARRHRVLYVEPPVSPASPLRYGLRPETMAEARRLLPPAIRREGRLHVLRMLAVPPLEHPRARKLSRPLLRAQLDRAATRVGLREPVVIAFRAMLELIGAIDEQATVYVLKDLVSAGGALLDWDGDALAAVERRMCERADLICVVTRRLQETFATRGIDAVLLPHGFHAELAPLYDAADRPLEYEDLGWPLIGYAGRIDARLDFAAIGAVAERYPGGSVLLIGPISPRLPRGDLERLTSLHRNVRVLAARSREELPAYLTHLDCLLMPYRESDWAAHGSPLKLWDYLYAGPPIVGSGYLTLADHPFVSFARPSAALADVVETALRDGADDLQQRRKLALANTWDDRASMLDALIRTA